MSGIKNFFFSALLIITNGTCLNAQTSPPDTTLNDEQQKALQLLNTLDTTVASAYWPHVPPAAFYNNVKTNILHPEKIYQGHATNFCGYSALSVVLCRTQPLSYTTMILSLYTKGSCGLSKEGKNMVPSAAVKEAAGTLEGKGKLNINPADQLWFLAMPDYFKGYMNLLDHHYKKGDENTIWAAVTLGKFNNMAKELGRFKTHSAGSDLVRPAGKNNVAYIQSELSKGNVVLFVNSKYLHPSKFRIYNLRMPTHFIVLYSIKEVDGRVAIMYWDYGLKTVTLMSESRLKKLVYGIIRLNEKQ